MDNIIELERIEVSRVEPERVKVNYVDLNSTDLGVKTERKELEVYFPKKRKTIKERLMGIFHK